MRAPQIGLEQERQITFIKAYSKRDSQDNRRGSSDPDAMVGRDGRSYGLGDKAHIAGDV